MRHPIALAVLAAAALVAGCTNEVGVTCPPGQTLCGTVCVYTTQDPQNCGSCGNVCAGDTVCIGGVCGCPKGQMACSGKCIDIKSDVANCGACGNACPVPQVCSLSACAGSCATGLTECNRNCVDLSLDDRNCGVCGNVCVAGEKCTGGACLQECPAGQTLCSNKCVNTSNDGQNCGACGNICPNDYFCVFGICILGCPQPLTRCVPDGGASDGGSQCVDTRFDPTNCGGCGGADVSPQPTPEPAIQPHVCKVTDGRHTNPVCDVGRCAATCEDGFLDCRFSRGGGEGRQPPPWSEPNGLPPPPSTPAELACYDFQSDPCNCNGCFSTVNGWQTSPDKTGLDVCFNFAAANQGFYGGTLAACCDGQEVTLTDPSSCGTSCADVAPCPSIGPTSCCPTHMGVYGCTDTSSDLRNCGGCDNFGQQGRDCTTDTSNPAPACCGSLCANLTNDAQNCGGCGTVCPGPTPSSIPTCCPNPSPVPVGLCFDAVSDQHHCGDCSTDCDDCPCPATCINGSCNGCSSCL